MGGANRRLSPCRRRRRRRRISREPLISAYIIIMYTNNIFNIMYEARANIKKTTASRKRVIYTLYLLYIYRASANANSYNVPII